MSAHRRILVIEDNPDTGAALCALLKTWGHNAVLAETGRQGLREALAGSLDVIVVDLALGPVDLDGFKIVRLIRAEPTGAMPIIIAYSGAHHREAEAMQAGCDAFILKPAVEELESLVGLARVDVRKYAAYAGSALARRRQNRVR
jgi:CheY-like chemotaxis protein